MRRPLPTRRVIAAAVLSALAWSPARAAAQQPAPSLAQLRFDIVGVRLVVDPPALTVPKNIATQVNTSLLLPPETGGDTRDAIATLTAGATVEAELRGPDLTPTRIVTTPGQPIPIPPLAVPGDYFLDGIRLVKNGATILDATTSDGHPATTIPIKVINEVFVTSVTSRPLSLEEIQGKGIVIDETNFRAVNFQVAFNIDGAPFTIELPAALPTPKLLAERPTTATLVQQLTAINRALQGTETKLPPEFDRPGLNFSIAALPFVPVVGDADGIPALDIPPITGIVLIPGNVAFLHQFFSVLLMVTNVAPDGTPLELGDATATITLPTGRDHVAGTFDAPGDDPLRLARVEGIGVQPAVPIAQRGADGVLGTADDIGRIPPAKSGEGEFLVEGLQEGSQSFDLTINATLFGLPSGPVALVGQAAGAVLVRNPTFSVTVAHPRTIRSGETYDLYATVTNTSQSTANLVSLNLEPASISGAQLLSDSRVAFDTIPAGQSATAKFTLVAEKTGSVTFSSFTGEAAAGGAIQLTTGVDERGAPLAPNAIVLPESANQLPADLIAAAERVLGQAFSIATAPAEALPPGVLFVKRQTVVDRGVALAEAGERIQFGEPLGRVVQDLWLDWLGNAGFDPGFDQILRTTDAGAAFLAEIARIVAADAGGRAGLDYQQSFALAAAGRAPHLSAIVTGEPGAPTPFLNVAVAAGGAIGDSTGGVDRSLPSGSVASLANPDGDGRLALVGVANPGHYTIEVVSRAAGAYDIGVVVPGSAPGQLVQRRFPGVQLDAGGRATLEIDVPSSGTPSLSIDRNADGIAEGAAASEDRTLVEQPPAVVAVHQLASSFREGAGDPQDPATYGLLVGVLFDKPVTAASAERTANYTIDANAVIGARLQQSGRLVYLYLRQPIGALVPRTLSVTGVVDARGNLLAASSQPIVPALTDGARVFGQVRTADGRGVPGSTLDLKVSDGPFAFDVATILTDANGSFDFDFVPRIGNVVLTAQHPTTLDLATVTAQIRGQGQQLLLNPTFIGRGSVRGRVLAADGASVVPGAHVALLPGSVAGEHGFETFSDALGEFSFADVPAGVFTLAAADASGGFGQTTGVLAGAGQTAALDVELVTRPEDGGRLVGRVFAADGSTPAAGFLVYVGSYKRDSGALTAIDQTTTDGSGSFEFPRSLPPGDRDVVAFNAATGEIGVVRAAIVPLQTTSVSVIIESVGAVEGVVFNAAGQPQAGAMVAGGSALVVTDANGFFRVEGVPAGPRTLEAGDPATHRRGSVSITVLPGQTVRAAITLEARATITGRVLDANGNPVPGATVRIPAIDGFTFVFANDDGVFTFPDLPLGDYLIQAPGPPRDDLVAYLQSKGFDPSSAFTSGGAPPGIGGSAPTFGDANAVLAAYQQATQAFLAVDDSLVSGLPAANLGGFGWTRVRLLQDSTTEVADVRFLAQGSVAGRTVDAAGRPIGAVTRITGLAVDPKGFPTVAELARTTTDAATGAFSFSGVPVFDLGTFQAAAVRAGDFTLEAAHPFTPVIAQVRGQLTPTSPAATDVLLQFPDAAATNGTISGTVLMPDGTSPAPQNTQVAISFGDLTVLTDATGRFQSLLPLPAGLYSVTALSPTGLRGQATALVPAGGAADVRVRLLGLGSTTISVRRPNGQAVANASVTLERGTFPGDRLTGTTDVNGQLHFANVTEGLFGVVAEEAITGLAGRTSGAILRDADVPATVVITGSGRVTGRFVTADGSSTVPFAQLALTTGGVRSFATTDANGLFEMIAIPVGSFTIDATDPRTGRVGRGDGRLDFEGQTVDVTVVQVPRGIVTGLVLQADGVTAVPAANVTIAGSNAVPTELQATARADGSFRFEGIPAGNFTLTARDPLTGFEGSATGQITFENDTVDRRVTLAPFGSITVTVRDAAGAIATNATATVSSGETFSRTAAVDVNGQARFDFLALGSYHLVARSLASAGNGGEAAATIEQAGQAVDVPIGFRGVGHVVVTAVGADGTTRIASARVTLTAKAAAAAEAPGALAQTLVGFTDGAGQVTFDNVPVGELSATAESGPLAGVSTATLAADDQTAPVTVQLGASAIVRGRVLLPDGATPAARAIVTLRFASQSTLQNGLLQITTDLSGGFEFRGIPLGSVSVNAFEVVSHGVRNVAGSLTSGGQQLDLGDVVLDNAGPRVVSVDPADRSSNVPTQPAIAVTFSEPIDTGSVNGSAGGNLTLLDGPTPVTLGGLVFSNGNRTVTVQPAQPLRSNGVYTLTIHGAPDGPKDEGAGLPLPDAFVSTFVTRDVIPPTVVSVSPAATARQVPPDAVVRIAFSEPIAAATLVVRDAAGTPVSGQTALTTGNAAVTFVPVGFLTANTTYSVTLAGVTDAAGNPLAGGPVSFTFDTVDTIAPQITALTMTGTPRAGSTVSVVPTISGSDLDSVEFLVGTAVQQVRTTPFAAQVIVPAGVSAITISATAFDQAGNRSSTFTQSFDVVANQPPTIALHSVVPLSSVAQGQTVEFEATAADDDQVAQVALSAVGAASFSELRAVPPGQAQFTTRFSIQVPATAPSNGTLTVQAAAVDSAGARSAPAILTLPVRDGRPPTVAFLTPVSNAQVLAGQPLDVTIDAADDAGVTSVRLVCAPALPGCETRTINPAAAATEQHFTVSVSADFTGSSIALLATAADAAGNAVELGRTVFLPDTARPVVTALQSATGSTRVIPGTAAALLATVSDNVGVTSLSYQTEGAFVANGSVPLAPAVAAGQAAVNVPIPAGIADGSTITVRVRAHDAAGNQSDEAQLVLTVGDTAPPTLTIVSPAEGANVAPGQNVILVVHAADDTAVQRIVFSASGAFTAAETRVVTPSTAVEASFAVTLPTTTNAGPLALTAEAFDLAGNSSGVQTRTVAVADVIAPTVQLLAAPGPIDPRQPLTITVEAADAVGVTSVSFTATGAAAFSETRAVTPPATSRAEAFTITVSPPPSVGGTISLSASARDAAGNVGTAVPLTLDVQDVVPPVVSSIVPANGATNVDPSAPIVVTFSERLDRTTATAAAVHLTRSSVAVPFTFDLAGDDRTITLTPAPALSVNTVYAVAIDATVTDRAGHALAAPFLASFTTSTPDAVPPRVTGIDPPDNATGVPTTTPVSVTFTEPVDPASITPESFAVRVADAPVPGTFSVLNSGRVVQFAPASPWPFEAVIVTELTGGITDLANNHLVGATGDPIVTPLTFTFLTGNFAITSPGGTEVVENAPITLTAAAGGSLNVASVVFTVNGSALPAVTAPPFSVGFTVPPRATAASLTIVASARNAQNAEVATAQKTVNVVGGLLASPGILGIPRGATRSLRFSVADPAAEDLPIALSIVDAGVASLSAPRIVIRAGDTSAAVNVTACTACPGDPAPAGSALGNTALLASSARGPAAATVSVSDPVAGQEVTGTSSPAGVSVTLPPSAGRVFTAAGRASTVSVQLLSAPLAGSVPLVVTVTNSNGAVVSATASAIQPGEQTVSLSLDAIADGIAVLTLHAGGDVRSVTVFVGAPPPGQTPPALASPVGVSFSLPPSAGQIFGVVNGSVSSSFVLLGQPLGGTQPLGVTVSSSNPAVATASAAPIQPGSQVAGVAITTIAEGTAILTFRAGTEIRTVTVVVGTPQPSRTPLALAAPTGVSIAPLPFIGKAFAPAATPLTLGVLILEDPAAVPTPVTVTSSDPAVVRVNAPTVTVPAGSRMVSLDLSSGIPGTATVTLEANGLRRQFTIEVGGLAAPNRAPVIAAPPIGVSVVPAARIARISVAPGAPVAATLGVQLLSVARGTPTSVRITTSDTSIAQLGGGATTVVTIPAGSLVVPVGLFTSGVEGAAVIDFDVDGTRQELLVVVGQPPASQIPAVTAPVIGIRIGS